MAKKDKMISEVLDHRGITLNFPLGALADLGLARAYALQSDTAKVAPLTMISSRSGKMPTPTFPSSSLPKPNTPS